MERQPQRGVLPKFLLCIAAFADESLLVQWENHLLPLQQAGLVLVRSERHITVGTDRTAELFHLLDQADGVILLLSADFFADNICLALMRKALQRNSMDGTLIVPLLARSVAWQESDVGKFAALPSNGIAIISWESQDEGWKQSALELQRLLSLPISRRAKNIGSNALSPSISYQRLQEFFPFLQRRRTLKLLAGLTVAAGGSGLLWVITQVWGQHIMQTEQNLPPKQMNTTPEPVQDQNLAIRFVDAQQRPILLPSDPKKLTSDQLPKQEVPVLCINQQKEQSVLSII